MISILNEILKLRNNEPIDIDYSNTNRYRVVANEPDGSKTGYYFNTPIYNIKTRKSLDMKFHTHGSTIYSVGSNTQSSITNNIRMDGTDGFAIISIEGQAQLVSDREISCGKELISPTTNGVAIKSSYQNGKAYTFSIEVSNPYLETRANDKCFALMSEMFRPFLSISCIGTINDAGRVIAPALIRYQKISDRKYTVSVSPCSVVGQAVLIEANLYDPKLFQDTTVESKNPTVNNAFGGIGFIGTTNEFGEQWLYSKMDYSKIDELNGAIILKAMLHIPKLNSDAVALKASQVSARFCSFGSNWDNKKAETTVFADSHISEDYFDLDLTSLISDKHGRLRYTDGFILKSKSKDIGFSVIATGDNYFTPQILEIKYR